MVNPQDTKKQLLEENRNLSNRVSEMEISLNERDAILSSIKLASPMGIGTVKDREFTSVNNRFCHMVGYSEKDLIGKNSRMVYSSDEEFDRVGKEKYEQIKKFGIGTVETIFKRKDGNEINVLLSSTPLDPNDLTKEITFTALDISEMKKTEKNHRYLIEQALIGLVVIQDFRIVFANDAFSSIVGFSVQECLNLSSDQVNALVYEEDRKKVWGRLKERMEGEYAPTRYQLRIVDKFNKIIWLDMSANRIEFNGKHAVQAVFVDISEQVNTLRLLESSEKKFKDVFNNVSDFLYIHDLEGNLIETNLAFQRELGYSEQELIKMNVKELIPNRFHGQFPTYLKDIVKETDTEGLLTIKTKSGKIRIVEYKNSLIVEYEKPQYIRGSARDITDRIRIEKTLKTSENRYRSLIEQSPISTILYQPDGKPIFGNKASAALWSMDQDLLELVYQTYNIFEDEQLIAQGIMDWIKRGFSGENVETPPIQYDPSLTNPSYKGPVKWLRAFIYPIKGDGGVIREVVMSHEDITERRKSDKALQESESKYRSLVNNINLGIFRTTGDPSGNFVHTNSALAKMFGYDSVLDILKIHVKDLYAFEVNRQELLLELRDQGYVKDKEIQLKRKDGSIFWGRLNANPSLDDNGEVMWLDGVIEDITEKKKLEDQLVHRVFHDELTNLPNRALFMDRLENAIKRGKRDSSYLYAVLFMDLDRFKVVNDSLGHDVGDLVLRNIGKLLKSCVREVDTVARFAGDEFIILLENIQGARDVITVAERIKETLNQPQKIDKNHMVVNGTIGIAMKPNRDISAEDIVRDADIAMYRAKKTGKNRWEIFNTEMLEDTIEKLNQENELRYSVENKYIKVHYQPIINLISREIIGFEALVRWDHPEKGLIYPGDFIKLAEETGLIVNMGKIVIRNACQDLKKWSENYDKAKNFTMSINLSGRQLLEPNLLKDFEDVFKETQLDPHRLRVEITEENVITDINKSIEVLNKLSSIGINAQIDDFGKGYSSLSMLHQLPIKTVKIDRTFVDRIKKGGKNIGFAKTIIMLANDLGMEVIAEGIERKEQIDELIKVGCQFGQGYYFSKPVESKLIEKLIIDQ